MLLNLSFHCIDAWIFPQNYLVISISKEILISWQTSRSGEAALLKSKNSFTMNPVRAYGSITSTQIFISSIASNLSSVSTMLSPKSFTPSSKPDHDGYALADRVVLKNKSEGVIKYIGDVKDNQGVWIGIELTSDHQGRHNGTRDDVTYFVCPSDKGLLIQTQDISSKLVTEQPGSPPNPKPMPAVTSSAKGSTDDHHDDVLSETDDDEDTDSGPLLPSDATELQMQGSLRSQDTLYRVLKPKTGTFQRMEEAVYGASDQKSHLMQSSLSMQHEAKASALYNDTELEDSHSIMKSTLKKEMRAWVDPWECAVQDTFYHKQIDKLRPTFEVLNQSLFDHAAGGHRRTDDLEHNHLEDDEDNELVENEKEMNGMQWE